MDIIMIVLNTLIIVFYIVLIAFLTPITMRFMKKRGYDLFMQLIPVALILFISSLSIAIGLGGFSELLFFKVTTIVSTLLLCSLLFLTLAMRVLWKEKYDLLIKQISSLRNRMREAFH
ncbi:hypothetical protein ACFQ38_13485 [Sporosarcina contaminans]|uniref:DUF1616 domain-containing protein n=1 Tax=Sporosarcina contaminans TaxID=633403 RepID=A0ABW3TZB5_9BACL